MTIPSSSNNKSSTTPTGHGGSAIPTFSYPVMPRLTATGIHNNSDSTATKKQCSITDHVKKFVKQAYYSYEMEMTTYVLDPWEKIIFNTCVSAIVAGSGYFAYSYLRAYAS